MSWTSAHAHAPDTSYLRAAVSKHALELRFTFDLATLYRIVRLDTDNDGRVSRAEAEAAAPAIADFLTQGITLELNGTEEDLGAFQALGWPVDVGDAVEEKDYGQALLHFTFVNSSQKLIEDVYVFYEVFAQLGAVHRAVADIEQERKHLEVVFTQFEPDYLYDTFWRPEAARSAAPEAKGEFRQGVQMAWNMAGIPLMLLAAGLMLPRKIPLLVMVGAMGWFVWDFVGCLNGLQRGLPEPFMRVDLITLGWFSGMLVSAVVAISMAAPLRRYGTSGWFLTVCWALLLWGAVDVTAHVFACRLGCG